jgi:hypothetical protein
MAGRIQAECIRVQVAIETQYNARPAFFYTVKEWGVNFCVVVQQPTASKSKVTAK